MTAHDANQVDRRRWVSEALDQYERPLTRYASRILRDEDAARDVVQHAFVRLCDEDPSALDGRLSAWLYAVCRNRAVDLLRRNGRCESLSESHGQQVVGREPDPAEAAQRRDLYQWLLRLLDGLPDAQREALDLWRDGFSYREISEITQCGEGNVRVLVHRALTWLRQQSGTRELLEPTRSAAANPTTHEVHHARRVPANGSGA